MKIELNILKLIRSYFQKFESKIKSNLEEEISETIDKKNTEPIPETPPEK